jgi:phage tail sheath protein FI
VRGFLDGVWRDGGLFGATADEAYYVRFPEIFNRDEDRALGKLTLEIGLRVSYPAEFIIIRIGLLSQSAATA